MDIAKYVSEIEPDRWALHQNVLSKKLYGWRTTNFVESENAKALHARGRNPTLFSQYCMEKWMLTKFKRFDRARKWVEAGKKVTPKAKELMSEQAENARYHDISLSNEDVGFVRDMRGSPPVRRRVNLLERTCTCSFFYQYGIPCSHIYSMLAFIDQPESIFDFFDWCYLVETYMRANDAATSNIELVLDDHIQADEEVQPPIASRKRGRPRKKRIASQGEARRSSKQTKCSQCGELGHNRRTCQHQ
ncbi:SWIM zinc finger domain-containing protein [Phytophthora infestans]|uniref:SWIM zinc finger domain-containing protein n=1 Tax=Phytophthora infestans TaxID=4787 RepID=A0A8S9U787_PHYIN|nr:SWIM zinc finger domain-containing protein [Phytophthora infestans]